MKRFLYVKAKGAENYCFSEHHPLSPQRFLWAEDLAKRLGILTEADIISAEEAPLELVTKVHSPRYVECVKALSDGNRLPELLDYGFGSVDNPPFVGMFEAAMAVVSGTVTAAEAVMDGVQVAVNLSGGLHHAKRSQASGFCIFNDPAIAIVALKQRFNRIIYIDIDAHHGDGVQWFFYEDPNVLTLSIHQSGRYLFPGTGHTDEIGSGPGAGTAVNIPLERYTADEIWWWAFEQVVPRVFNWFRPEVIVFQMGADAHFDDPLTQLQLTVQGWQRAVEWVAQRGIPIVATGGGGYSLCATARMWAWALATLKGVEMPRVIPPDHFLYQYTRHIPDLFPPEQPEGWRQLARRFAQETVESLRRNLQPYGIWGETTD